jgi:riboflavin synthase
MFTGIVEELGQVAHIEPLDEAVRLSVKGPEVAIDARPGDSIAVNGVCLTVVTNVDGVFTADVMLQTLAHTSLGALRVGAPVNLERAVTPTTRLGGHIVQGHVDGVGRIRRVDDEGIEVEAPAEVLRYCVEKGSIAVEGVSLTIAALGEGSFTIALIPHTREATTLGNVREGDEVNLEVDVVAKYVERLASR